MGNAGGKKGGEQKVALHPFHIAWKSLQDSCITTAKTAVLALFPGQYKIEKHSARPGDTDEERR